MFNVKYTVNCIFLVIIFGKLVNSKERENQKEQRKLVGNWANTLGDQLYHLGLIITKQKEIKQLYVLNNAQVSAKNATLLLSNITDNVHRMFQRKMDAIQCVRMKAEEAVEGFDKNITMDEYNYTSSKYSGINESYENEMYLPMKLNSDTHFYNIEVDTDKSSIHVPMNIFDRHKEPKIAVQWSEELDSVFKNNYQSDPSLSWQYFCSSSGVMRHYPAKKWIYDENTDIFDCRIRTWYIEATTCTKDVVILLDNSGSMEGMNSHIASLTVYSILDTLSNNDYINIMSYSQGFNYTVPCFEGLMMKATSENIEKFKEAVRLLNPNGKTNVESALIESLNILKKYRGKRNCSETDPCNQAIMIITDGVTKNYTNLLLKYNSFENGTRPPVRIFTYLIGTEATAEREIREMACRNRGYYSHIDTLEQVTKSVYEYVKVIARPLVLQGTEHPISWTHAYADPASVENGHIRLLTSAAIPTFDGEQLLGVAGTDVPIDELKKLTYPYNIGVNAHVFIISNNGYIIVHPAWRPIFWEKKLKTNYNSVDLTEVLLLDDGQGPRVIGDQILELREALLTERDETEMLNVSLKYHYNDMQRVAREQFDFYWKDLADTPFTVSLAISKQYGYFSIQVPNEIKRTRHTGEPFKNFFAGTNWKVHPRWVYCKYHYLEGHEFNSPEDELLHFLDRMPNRTFKWTQQYVDLGETDESERCNKQTLGHDDYFCDEELIKMLIFDARCTKVAFGEPWHFMNDREISLFERFNATLRFVATMSGLTRWEYIFGEGNETKKEFGDYHAKAQDETWYKMAVLQHQYDPESFVYSVPVDPMEEALSDMSVTASYAIFVKDAGMEAPASVVGFQFALEALTARFFEITSAKIECKECKICEDSPDGLDCFIIDHSGYIIASSNLSNTGVFFGKIYGAVMERMLEEGIYEQITLYDYQGVCTQNGTQGRPVAVSERKENRIESEDLSYFPCDQSKTLYILNQRKFIYADSNDDLTTSCFNDFYVKRIKLSNLLLIAVNRTAKDCDVEEVYTNIAKEIDYENNTLHICQKKNLNELVRRPLDDCFYYNEKEENITVCAKGSIILSSLLLCVIVQLLLFLK
nr:voltage-dependent calcium channel subunit alpha-2/delta-4 [Onthophagus taurus]